MTDRVREAKATAMRLVVAQAAQDNAAFSYALREAKAIDPEVITLALVGLARHGMLQAGRDDAGIVAWGQAELLDLVDWRTE